MHTLRTTARLTFAALSSSLGATAATAAPPVVSKPNGFSWGMTYPPPAAASSAPANDAAKKPNNFSFGASNPTGRVKSARDLDGQSAGRTKTSNLGDTATHEVGHLKGLTRR